MSYRKWMCISFLDFHCSCWGMIPFWIIITYRMLTLVKVDFESHIEWCRPYSRWQSCWQQLGWAESKQTPGLWVDIIFSVSSSIIFFKEKEKWQFDWSHPREGTATPEYLAKQSFRVVIVANCCQGHQPPPQYFDDIMIIWYDMIWYDMIWYDSIYVIVANCCQGHQAPPQNFWFCYHCSHLVRVIRNHQHIYLCFW